MTTTTEVPALDEQPPARTRRLTGLALAVIAVVAAAGYAWGLQRDPLEPYYAAAVRSMAARWHDFFFGAFDPAGTVSLDKLPGAFWIQALLVRAFGAHTWVIIAPQVVEGVLAVLVLHRAVRRLAGRRAGLVAAGVLAVSPAVVALNRGNISDTLMILLLVLAADAVVGTVLHGGFGRPVLAGVWVGLAFQAKMLEAWLVLPALGLVVLLSSPDGLRRRIGQALAGGVAAGVVSLLWVGAVSLIPAGSRPWVDGSTADSLFEQVFVYNGLGRIGEATPLQILTGQGLGLVPAGPAPGWERLLVGDLGRDCGWLLVGALVVAVAGIVGSRRRPRTDPFRAAYLLWGVWLVTFAVAFSLAQQINAYYTAALAPAAAALVGIGIADARRHRDSPVPRVVAAVAVALTGLQAVVLLRGSTAPGWVTPLAVALVVVAIAVLVTSALRRRSAGLLAGGLAATLVAALAAPAIASVVLVARGQGVFDTPFESARTAAAVQGLFVATPADIARTLPTLERGRDGAPDLLAVQSAAVASVFAYPSGDEVLPIGGFTGTGPSPTLQQLRDDVAAGEFHLVLAFPGPDPRIQWVARSCRQLSGATPPFHDWFCVPTDATKP